MNASNLISVLERQQMCTNHGSNKDTPLKKIWQVTIEKNGKGTFDYIVHNFVNT